MSDPSASLISGMMYFYRGDAYYVRNGKRFRVYSPRVYSSWALPAMEAPAKFESMTELARAPLGFRDGTKILNYATGKLYIISGGKRRQIVSPDVMRENGWRKNDFLVVSDDEANLHENGEVIR